MAFADLSFAAALWRGRGLRWLTAPADLPPELSLCAAPAPVPPPPQGAPDAARSAGPAHANARGRPADSARRAQARDTRHAASQQSAARQPGSRWRPLAPADLPPAWRSRLSATRAGLVAWTYWALGHDLAPGDAATAAQEEARGARRAFLARLLRDLAHPAGTHTFWPACLPEETAGATAPGFAPHAEAFWSGAAHLGCRAVIVMGSAAARALGLPATARPFGQMRWRGQLVLVLRDVDALAQDATRYGPTLAFLRQGLDPVARLPRQAG